MEMDQTWPGALGSQISSRMSTTCQNLGRKEMKSLDISDDACRRTPSTQTHRCSHTSRQSRMEAHLCSKKEIWTPTAPTVVACGMAKNHGAHVSGDCTAGCGFSALGAKARHSQSARAPGTVAKALAIREKAREARTRPDRAGRAGAQTVPIQNAQAIGRGALEHVERHCSSHSQHMKRAQSSGPLCRGGGSLGRALR